MAASPARAIHLAEWRGEYRLEEDGDIQVVENLSADFNGQRRHGLKRWIPTAYRDPSGFYHNLRVEMDSVSDDRGTPWPVLYGRDGRNLTLRIGDPDSFAPDRADYTIRYRVMRAWIHEKDYDLFRWNVTGTEWEMPIDALSADIALPPGVRSDDPRLRFYCYTGRYGSTAQECRLDRPASDQLRVEAGPFDPGEGLSIEIELPAGSVRPPTLGRRISWFLKDNGILLLPVLVFLVMLELWRRHGSDALGKQRVVMPQYYPPSNLRPAEIGALVDETVDLRDISATILDLAVRGHLEIEEKKRDGLLFDSTEMVFLRRNPLPPDAPGFEQQLFEGLFPASAPTMPMSQLENRFFRELPRIRASIYESLKAKGYFGMRPDRVRTAWAMAGGVVGAVGVGVLITEWLFKMPWGIAFLLSGAIVGLFGRWMPRKTHAGSDMAKQALGFEEYVGRAEKDRIQRHKEADFHQYLPYAVALGIEKAWAERFKNLVTHPPSWYRADYGAGYHPFWMVHHWNQAVPRLHRAMTSSPRGQGGKGGTSGGFSGGGFSGGGFGGGGGGSW